MIATLTTLVLTYLLGAVPFGVALGTLYGADVDVRDAGSGNIGATNVARVHGRGLAAAVLALDALKGALPVLYGWWLWPDGGVPWRVVVGLVAVIGHCWPVYLDFRGGKGVATSAGAMLVISPVPTAIAAAAWAALLALTGRSSVASLAALGVLGAASYGWGAPLVPVALFGAVIVARHLPNLARLARGEEGPVVPAARPVGPASSPVGGGDVLRSDPIGAGDAAPAWRGASPADS
jgi:glycerol-3-phosphate acyltransferase PlsY